MLKKSFKASISFLFVMVMIALVVACGGGGGSGSDGDDDASSLESLEWSATPVSGGIQFSISALPKKYRYSYAVYITDENGTRCTPKWNNKAQAWTGVYPLVTVGSQYRFTLHISQGNDSKALEHDMVTAIGGLGELSYSAPGNVTLESKTGAQARAAGYWVDDGISDGENVLCISVSADLMTNSYIRDPYVKLDFFNGNGMTSTTWDGTWIGEISITGDITPPIPPATMERSVFDDITNDMMSGAGNRKIFVQASFAFEVQGYTDFEYSSAVITSSAINYPW